MSEPANFDFLKPVLGDDLFAQFSEKMSGAQGITLANVHENGGRFIPRAKYTEELGAKDKTISDYKSQIADLNGKLTQLQEAASGNDVLKGQIAQLQQDMAAKDAAMKQAQLSFSIRDAVRASKARNVDVVAHMIDTSKVVEANGQYTGINEQIEALKKSDAYLFEDTPSGSGGVDPHQPPAGSATGNASINDAIRRAAGR